MGLHLDLVAEVPLQASWSRAGRQAAELHRRAVGADRIDAAPTCLSRKDADEAVEIGLPLMVIVRIAFALDRLADVVGRRT